ENILYLGNAFGRDQLSGDSGMASVTAATFFVRIVLSPFAHPLFTLLTGIGFGLAARTPGRRRVRRVLLPLAGLLLSMGMHGLWNGSATLMGPFGFIIVYALVMVPVFGLSVWLLVWARADV
ncbi:PrsW family intramembrane metalloprotease, partial [Streptomyces sp. 4F]